MRTLVRISTTALLAAAVLAGTPTSEANCGIFTSFDISTFGCGGYCWIASPAAGLATDFTGAYWALGAGNPGLIGDGNPASGRDNGACTVDNWMFAGTPGLWGFYTNTDGCANLSYSDNCIDADVSFLTPDTVMVALCDKGGNWMLVATTQNGNGFGADTYFDLDGPGILGYQLRPTPSLTVTSSTRVDSTQRDISFTAPTLALLDDAYTDAGTGTPASAVITGVRVYTKIVGRGVPVGAERRVVEGAWVPALDAVGQPLGKIAPGVSGTFRVTCATDSDTYVGVEPVFEGATPFSSGCVTSSLRMVQCGPILAEPGFKMIQKERPARQR